MRELKVSTIDHRSGTTRIPFILFLAMMLVVVYPGQSQSAEKQFINTSQRTVTESKKSEEATKVTIKSIYQKMIGNVKRLVTFSRQPQPEEKQTRKTVVSVQSDFVKTEKSATEQASYLVPFGYKGKSAISPNKDNIYDILISVVKRQKLIESVNEELIEQLSQKDDTITSLKYTEEVLWNQLEESENKYWNTVTDKAYMEDALLAQLEEIENKYWNTLASKDMDYQQAKVLTDILDLKDYMIRALEDKERILRAQLETNQKKFQEALAARDAQYQEAVKRVSSSVDPVFGYSPPALD